MSKDHDLTEEERSIYDWQFAVEGFGEEGQKLLRNATALVSRVGGLGSVVAYELAAAGIGRMVLAHAGDIEPSDLNRQLLVTHAAIGTPRIESVVQRLGDLNPRLEVVPVSENLCDSNVAELVEQVDVIVDCAPLFEESYLMNREAIRQGKVLVEPSMYELQAQITTIDPGSTPCLRCLYPTEPTSWNRKFPVFGAVSGTVGCIAAMEVIKVLSGLGQPLYGRLLTFDLRDVSTRTITLNRRPDCPDCSHLS